MRHVVSFLPHAVGHRNAPHPASVKEPSVCMGRPVQAGAKQPVHWPCEPQITSISQGRVAARLRCGGIFIEDFVTNLRPSFVAKEFRHSVGILRSCGHEYSEIFLTDSCPVFVPPYRLKSFTRERCADETSDALEQ